MVDKLPSGYSDQYSNLGNELRFYADQRFKIMTVYLLTNGFVINAVKDRHSVALGILGIILSYLCLSWDVATRRWWGVVLESLKQIEQEGVQMLDMVEGYSRYPDRWPGFRWPRPSYVAIALYAIGAIGWVLFTIFSWPVLWWGAA